MRRSMLIAPNEYYHLLNRGNKKQKIFSDDRDRVRFLFLILFLQGEVPLSNVSYHISYFIKHRMFNISKKRIREIIERRYVELAGFVLMPNHFHLIVLEKEEGGISKYMQRVLNAYTKYFNTRHEQSGHLFQGPYKAIHITDDRQLCYLSAYIHRNPREMTLWRNKEYAYPWSSFQDYVDKNRWNELLENKIIIEQFKDKNHYKKFVDTSKAKESNGGFDED